MIQRLFCLDPRVVLALKPSSANPSPKVTYRPTPDDLMLMKTSFNGFLKLFSCSFLILSLSACGATVDPEKRKPLEILPIKSKLPGSSENVLVRFEETIPGKQLSETVWDNVSGANASVCHDDSCESSALQTGPK